MNPKVFISYSWTSDKHKKTVIEWADRLLKDGVDVVIDVYELKLGHDKYQYMERAIVDQTITHILLISDKSYSIKANNREAGVGVESTIISNEIYRNSKESKFIPIVCEFNEYNEPWLPVFVNSKIWLNFSSKELVESNWSELLRILFDKPKNIKPKLGKKPAFILSEGKQIKRLGVGFQILTPFKKEQLDRIYNLLSSGSTNERLFNNFILLNNGRASYWQLSDTGESANMTNSSNLFDIWKLMFLIIPELCGYNKNWILFDKNTPKYPWVLHPDLVYVTNEIFKYMTEQLIGVIRRISHDIPIISNSIEMIRRAPHIIMNDQEIAEDSSKRFVGRSPYVLDKKTGQTYFGREVFDVLGGEFESSITVEERKQIIADIGKIECTFILQDAFDSQGKEYEANEVIDMLIKRGYKR